MTARLFSSRALKFVAGGTVIGAAGASLMLPSSRSQATTFEDEQDWRKGMNRAQSFNRKLSGLVSHHLQQLSNPAPLEQWELEIAARPGLHMHRTFSTLAASASSDGLILKAAPRIYAPLAPLTDSELESEDLRKILDSREVLCVWHFGDDGVSHPLTVHGGAIAMAFDESFGHAFVSLGRGVGYTANLNINYRKPLPTGIPIMIDVQFEKLEGRKVFMRAKLQDGKGNSYCDGTSLYIVPRKPEDTQIKGANASKTKSESEAVAKL